MISYGYINSVFASNLTLLSSTNLSSTAATQAAPNVSHGSITLAGDDDYCGADNVIGRRAVTSTITGAITAFEQYQRFINDTEFSGMHPYGTSSTVVNWSGDGRTTNDIGYQGGLTGGNADVGPQVYGMYSWVSWTKALYPDFAGRTCREDLRRKWRYCFRECLLITLIFVPIMTRKAELLILQLLIRYKIRTDCVILTMVLLEHPYSPDSLRKLSQMLPVRRK